METRLQTATNVIREGLACDDILIYANDILKGRYQEEVNLDIQLKRGADTAQLLYVKVFYGRPPYYRPWLEFFNINEQVVLGKEMIDYFDSRFENELLQFFASYLGPGQSIFVKYDNDVETREQLKRVFPVALSRLGYKLLNLGFTWFKDWYFPEGFMEGDQRLQGEKPLDEESRNQHCRNLVREVEQFKERDEEICRESYLQKALIRVTDVKRMLNTEHQRRAQQKAAPAKGAHTKLYSPHVV
jgi:hypothetical protein